LCCLNGIYCSFIVTPSIQYRNAQEHYDYIYREIRESRAEKRAELEGTEWVDYIESDTTESEVEDN